MKTLFVTTRDPFDQIFKVIEEREIAEMKDSVDDYIGSPQYHDIDAIKDALGLARTLMLNFDLKYSKKPSEDEPDA